MEVTTLKITTEPVQQTTGEVKKKKSQTKIPPQRHSNFFMTLNTNKDVRSMPEEELNAFKKKWESAVDEFFTQKLQTFVQLTPSKCGLKFGWPVDISKEECYKRIIGTPVCDYAIEIGATGRLHCHAMFAVSKRALDTKLDYTGIREWFNNKMGEEIYFYNKMYNDAKASLQTYISKNPL